jgi:hypothetical protein
MMNMGSGGGSGRRGSPCANAQEAYIERFNFNIHICANEGEAGDLQWGCSYPSDFGGGACGCTAADIRLLIVVGAPNPKDNAKRGRRVEPSRM